jgi:hypothetical protein
LDFSVLFDVFLSKKSLKHGQKKNIWPKSQR